MKPASISFTAQLKKFETNGEKTGWTYIEILADQAQELKPGHKKSFRVKGMLDAHPIAQVALVPMGGGHFIMAINAAMRKSIGKRHGAMVQVNLQEDTKAYLVNKEFLSCLADDPPALDFFQTLALSHQNYFSKWIDDAKTDNTRIKRIAQSIFGLSNKMDFGQMIRYHKNRN